MMKSLNDQAAFLESDLAAQRRKFDRWMKQKRMNQRDATNHLDHLESILATIQRAIRLQRYLDQETGEESEFELSQRGDVISNMIMELCQVGPESVRDA